MAKKKTSGIPSDTSKTTAAPVRRRTSASRRSVDPSVTDVSAVTVSSPMDTAADLSNTGATVFDAPSYEEIAAAAYQRFLSRGGGDGRDFEDWVEAERALRSRRS